MSSSITPPIPTSTTSDAASPAKIRDVASSANILSREALISGEFLTTVRRLWKDRTPNVKIKSDEDLAREQAHFLNLQSDQKNNNIWVFGYGSLMWNPLVEFTERRSGIVKGWHRRLNLYMHGGRGTVENPGLTLGLSEGGVTEGVAMLLPAKTAEFELSLVWQRELISYMYLPLRVDVETEKGTIKAITFISNVEHNNYAGRLADKDIAKIVASASGALGSNAEYLSQTVASIKSLNLKDEELEHIQDLVDDIKSSTIINK